MCAVAKLGCILGDGCAGVVPVSSPEPSIVSSIGPPRANRNSLPLMALLRHGKGRERRPLLAREQTSLRRSA